MDSNDDRKRLMPEVLPRPNRSSGGPGPRERTRLHMNKLLSAAAAASAALAGCHDPPVAATTGYGVVDPMPPPARCPGLAAQIGVSATWKSQGGKMIIEVVLTRPAARPDVKFPGQEPYASGGKLLSASPPAGGDTLTLDFDPDPAVGSIYSSISVNCAEGPQTLSLTLTIDRDAGAPVAGSAVPAQLGE